MYGLASQVFDSFTVTPGNVYLFLVISELWKILRNSMKYSPCCNEYIYILLTEFEVLPVSYGPSFFSLLIYGPSAKRAGFKSKGKNEDP